MTPPEYTGGDVALNTSQLSTAMRSKVFLPTCGKSVVDFLGVNPTLDPVEDADAAKQRHDLNAPKLLKQVMLQVK